MALNAILPAAIERSIVVLLMNEKICHISHIPFHFQSLVVHCHKYAPLTHVLSLNYGKCFPKPWFLTPQSLGLGCIPG